MNKAFIIGVAVLIIYGFGYYTADQKWERDFLEFKLNSEKEYSALLEEKIKSDSENKNRISAVERKFLTELNAQKVTYEQVISDLHNNFHPSGVSSCPACKNSVSRPNSDTTELVCYTRSELRRKVAQSVAIGHEADELALKYNALLEVVNGVQK